MPYADKEEQRAAQRRHYLANKAVYVARATKRNNSIRDEIRLLKEASPCVDCGQYYPFYVMQYDHIGDDKVQDINRLTKAASRDRVMAEIAKCELVCANCHAARTYLRHNL